MDDFLPLFVSWLPMLAQGAATTASLCAVAMTGGFFAGVGIHLLQDARPYACRIFARVYISLFRGTPVLAQVLLCYYLPCELGVDIGAYAAAALALALNSAAYQSQILRGGLAAIPAGQLEAAVACGLGPWQALRHIRLPQVLRLTLPATISELIDVIKASAVVSAIAITDLMRVGQQLASSSYHMLSAYLAVALAYLALTSLLALAGRHIEQRWRKEAL
ncbi:amino acid ABC transporter permease [Acerihabitans arboris]|uniref:ABC transporter permease subunit n=1 Tax=Acerihabitans arboris TaxID=2691583 RepID=A0A845SEN5_9GAMM|nr:amino acid ABC transporter permease [Acerihabitans arboris]NDL61827.1 ABC transporter permease subunit [Acerihabitans arboris]